MELELLVLIGWQAYRETKYIGKTALHKPELKSKKRKKKLAGPIYI